MTTKTLQHLYSLREAFNGQYDDLPINEVKKILQCRIEEAIEAHEDKRTTGAKLQQMYIDRKTGEVKYDTAGYNKETLTSALYLLDNLIQPQQHRRDQGSPRYYSLLTVPTVDEDDVTIDGPEYSVIFDSVHRAKLYLNLVLNNLEDQQ
jgi:hypothetical protein